MAHFDKKFKILQNKFSDFSILNLNAFWSEWLKKDTDVSLLTRWFVAPPEDQEGQSEEDLLKQRTKERARKEFLGAVASEGEGNNYDISCTY